MNTQPDFTPDRFAWLRSKTLWVLIAFLAIVAFFLVTEHTAHFFGVLPYLLLLLCPLLHLFLHGGHDNHGASDGHQSHANHIPSKEDRS